MVLIFAEFLSKIAQKSRFNMTRLRFVKCSLLKKEHQHESRGNGSVSYIEYRAEEDEVIASPEGDPIREISVVEWEIKHIHHVTKHRSRITFTIELSDPGISEPLVGFGIKGQTSVK